MGVLIFISGFVLGSLFGMLLLGLCMAAGRSNTDDEKDDIKGGNDIKDDSTGMARRK